MPAQERRSRRPDHSRTEQPAAHGFAELIDGDYIEAEWDSLFSFGTFGSAGPRGWPGSRYAPARRHSELGHDLRLENLTESDSLKSRAPNPPPPPPRAAPPAAGTDPAQHDP